MSENGSVPMMAAFFEALAKAQGEFLPMTRDSENPFFKSRYSSLAASIAATRPALTKYGLCVSQDVCTINGSAVIGTLIAHKGGGSRWSSLTISLPADPQKAGSLLTYMRRYCRNAALDIAPTDDDDDGERASADHREVDTRPRKPPPGKSLDEMSLPEQVYALATDVGMKGKDKIVAWASDSVGHPLDYTNPRTGKVVQSLLALTPAEAESLLAKLRPMQEMRK